MDEDPVEQDPIAVMIEYHTYGAPTVGNTVQTQYASVYLAKGVSADKVMDHIDMERPGAAYLQVARRLPIRQAEVLVETLVSEFERCGIPAQSDNFFDE